MSNNQDMLLEGNKDEIMRRLLLQRLKNKQHLRQWCKTFLEVDLQDCTVSRFSTSNPLDMVWEVYDFCLRQTNQDEPESHFYIAGRSSQKTLSCAVIQILMPLHFGRGVVHFGGTEDQANRQYVYFKKFVSRPYIAEHLKEEPKMSITNLSVNGKESSIEVLALTAQSVQGAHQPIVTIDELVSLAPNKVAAYPDIAGVPSYTEEGLPWVKVGISSRKGRHTVIEKEYDERERTGAKFKFWTVFENTQRCPDSRSGTQDLEMFVSVQENKALLKDDYLALEPEQQIRYERVIAKEKCIECPLRAVCAGDAKKQTSKCKALRPIQATISNFKQSNYDWFLSQSMSMQPSADDLVYPRFDRTKFIKTPREMLTIFMGEDPGTQISEQVLIDQMKKIGVKRYAGLDHGYTHPTAIVIVYEDARGNAYVMRSVEVSGLEPPQKVDLVKSLHNIYDFTIIYCDPEDPSTNGMIGRQVRVGAIFKKDVSAGHAFIRYKMSPPYGDTKLFGLEGNTQSLVDNFEKYHFKKSSDGKLTEEVQKTYDDSHDALSYVAQNRWKLRGEVHVSAVPIQDTSVGKTYTSDEQGVWLKDEIQKTIVDLGGNKVTKSSKKGGFYWDI